MRVNRTWRSIAFWTCAVLFFFALAPEALAGSQLPLPSSWAPATVFGLMLITAARERHQRTCKGGLDRKLFFDRVCGRSPVSVIRDIKLESEGVAYDIVALRGSWTEEESENKEYIKQQCNDRGVGPF